MTTTRLYYADAQLREFEAKVVEQVDLDGRAGVVLDRTAFYPTGGGQPHDVGELSGARVVDVISRADDKTVVHLVDGDSLPAIGATVTGVIDDARRFDHTQQHSGQHLLSQCFVEVAGLETISFHLGEERCSIDLRADEVSDEVLRRTEALANAWVTRNRPVRVHQVTREEMSPFPIRRETYAGDEVRIIEIDGFDYSTCGGTHVQSTAEIGPVAVLGTERIRQDTRVEFVCGVRVLAELHRDRAVVEGLTRTLTTGREGLVARVEGLLEDGKAQRRRIKDLSGMAAGAEADRLCAAAESVGGLSVVIAEVDGDLDFLRAIAGRVTKRPGHVALLGCVDGGQGRLIVQRAGDADASMRDVLSAALQAVDGRGGGSPQSAQGVVPDPGRLGEALRAARAALS